ncbi:MAG: hypothetical protein RMJ97_01645 [Raineya sp.]|nr:hypothetical protein [Raineya sp.]MDW8295563.1 hypothetical protein [Raineya sp.]
MQTDKLVEMLVGQEPVTKAFIQKVSEYDSFSSQELLDRANEGQMDIKGDIYFTLSEEDRLIIFLIITSRILQGENVTPFHKKFVMAIFWAFSYLDDKLLKIILCAYHLPIIKESIWNSVNSNQRTLWSRVLDWKTRLKSIQRMPYLPQDIFTDLQQVAQKLEGDLHNSNDNDKDISKKEFQAYQAIFNNILQDRTKPLPPKLPPIGEFLAKHNNKGE